MFKLILCSIVCSFLVNMLDQQWPSVIINWDSPKICPLKQMHTYCRCCYTQMFDHLKQLQRKLFFSVLCGNISNPLWIQRLMFFMFSVSVKTGWLVKCSLHRHGNGKTMDPRCSCWLRYRSVVVGKTTWVFFVFWQSPGDNESCGAATSESQQDDSLQVGFFLLRNVSLI